MKGTRQAVVALDIALFGAGAVKTAIGLVCAVAIGAWLHAWVAAVFLVAGILLVRGMYWSSLLVLIGSAYADWPARQWLGVELSEYVPIQALVAVPLWLVVMEYPSRLEGRAKYAAWVCCFTAFVAGWGAPFLQDGRYWLVAAPLALAAVVVLVWRMWRAHVPMGTRGWICCAAIAPMACTTTIQVLAPATVPFFVSTVPLFNVWLSLGPLALIVLHIGGKRHDRQGGKRVARLGMGASSNGGGPRHHLLGWVPGVVRDVLPVVGSAAFGGPAAVPSGEAQLQAEAEVHGGVRARDEGRIRRAAGRGAAEDDRFVGRHDLLRPAPAEVEPEDFGTGPLTPLAKEAR